MNNIKLNKNEIICPECNGKLFIDNKIKITDARNKILDLKYKDGCNKCNMKGKIDWVDNLIGYQSYSNTSILIAELDLKKINITVFNNIDLINYNEFLKDKRSLYPSGRIKVLRLQTNLRKSIQSENILIYRYHYHNKFSTGFIIDNIRKTYNISKDLEGVYIGFYNILYNRGGK